jgi:hypothetical protein
MGIAAFVRRSLGRPSWIAGASIFLGIVIGVVLDATYDHLYNSRDRNLFPFEIGLLWGLALWPALIGSTPKHELDRLLGKPSGKD